MAFIAQPQARLNQMNNKIQELTVKVSELDSIRSRQQKKITQLKDQVMYYLEFSKEKSDNSRNLRN